MSEDAQKAIILHNLEEEVLILGTDLKADKKTGIIRFIPAPTTLCVSSTMPFSGDQALYAKGSPCLNLPVGASTSALIVKEEEDIKEIYPEGESFFKDQKAFIQVIRYMGQYSFTEDIFVDVSQGLPHAVGAHEFEEKQDSPWGDSWLDMFPSAEDAHKKRCSLKPDRGPCKGNFMRYYYDPMSKTCKEFLWGGCGGVVPFETKEECEKCKKVATERKRK